MNDFVSKKVDLKVPLQCCRKIDGKRCEWPAEFVPVLHIFSRWGKDNNRVPYLMAMELSICSGCSKGIGAEDFLCDQGWQDIVDTVVMSGREEPERELTEVQLVKIEDSRSVM